MRALRTRHPTRTIADSGTPDPPQSHGTRSAPDPPAVGLDRDSRLGPTCGGESRSRDARAVLIVGAQAAGKTSVGQALARRFDQAAFIEGDALWQMIVAGLHDMSASVDPEAERQLALRYRHGALLCESFVHAGFSAVHVENMYGPIVEQHLRTLRCPAIARRAPAQHRCDRAPIPEPGGEAYRPWIPPGGSIRDAIRRFDEWIARPHRSDCGSTLRTSTSTRRWTRSWSVGQRRSSSSRPKPHRVQVVQSYRPGRVVRSITTDSGPPRNPPHAADITSGTGR